jgi:choloylglycine hydrolase
VQLTDADNRLDNSIDRFATACSMIQSFQKADNKVKGIDYSFSILNAISQGNYTKWSVVYDIKNRFVYFKTNDANDIKHIAFEQLDFSCKKGPLAFDIKQKVKGNIRSHFQPYSFESNLRLTKQALQESSNAIQVNEKEQAVFFNYPKTTVCQ